MNAVERMEVPMDAHRTEWNAQHKALRQALRRPEELDAAKALFMAVHAPLHEYSVSGTSGWNLAEELWQGLSEADFRIILEGGEHSIAWCLWHLARIEDMTMNLLVAGNPQVISQDDWRKRLHAPILDTGNLISDENVRALSAQVDFAVLREYRSAVGKSTRMVVAGLSPTDLRRKVSPERLKRLLAEGAVAPYAQGLLDYWGGLTVAGLLLMPPTRHNLVHLSECLILKHKAQKFLKQ